MTTLVLPGGETYLGAIDSSQRPSGRGKLINLLRYSFDGDFFKGQASGVGVVRNPDGNLINGFHSFEYLNYGRYDGDFVNGMRSGFGIFTWLDGRTIEGQFSNDKRNGLMLFTDSLNQKTEETHINNSCQSEKPAGDEQIEAASQRRTSAEQRWVTEEKARKTVVQVSQREIDEYKQTIQLQCRELSEKDQKITQLLKDARNKDTHIEKLEIEKIKSVDKVSAKEQQLQGLQEQIIQIQDEIQRNETEYTAKDQIIEQQTLINRKNDVLIQNLQANIKKLSTDNQMLQQQIKTKTEECNQLQNERKIRLTEYETKNQQLVQLQGSQKQKAEELAGKTLEVDQLKGKLKIKTEELTVKDQQIVQLKEVAKQRASEAATFSSQQRREIEQSAVESEAQRKQMNQISQQAALDGQKMQQHVEQLQNENNALMLKNQATAQQSAQQIGQQYNQQWQELQLQLQQAHQRLLQSDAQQARSENEMLRTQLKLKDDISTHKDEVQMLKNENNTQKEEIRRLQNMNTTCTKCGCCFLGNGDLVEHQNHCEKIPCPLCGMRLRSLVEFCEHSGSHLKRDAK